MLLSTLWSWISSPSTFSAENISIISEFMREKIFWKILKYLHLILFAPFLTVISSPEGLFQVTVGLKYLLWGSLLHELMSFLYANVIGSGNWFYYSKILLPWESSSFAVELDTSTLRNRDVTAGLIIFYLGRNHHLQVSNLDKNTSISMIMRVTILTWLLTGVELTWHM